MSFQDTISRKWKVEWSKSLIHYNRFPCFHGIGFIFCHSRLATYDLPIQSACFLMNVGISNRSSSSVEKSADSTNFNSSYRSLAFHRLIKVGRSLFSLRLLSLKLPSLKLLSLMLMEMGAVLPLNRERLFSSAFPKPVALTVTRISSFMASSITIPQMMLASSCASFWTRVVASLI